MRQPVTADRPHTRNRGCIKPGTVHGQRARGATHYQALRALARLVGILHGCLRHHTLYDENRAWHTGNEELRRIAA